MPTNTDETPGTLVTDVPNLHDDVDESTMVQIPQERLAALESRVSHLSDIVSKFSQNKFSQRDTQPELEPQRSLEDEEHNSAHLRQSLSNAYLSKQGGGKLRYIEPVYWAAMCREIAELDEIVNDFSTHVAINDDPTHSNGDLANKSGASTEASFSGLVSSPDRRLEGTPRLGSSFFSPHTESAAASKMILEKLPPKSECDRLLLWYFKGCHPVVPLVHEPKLRQRYENFWPSISNSPTFLESNLPFLTLFLALLYAGSLSCPPSSWLDVVPSVARDGPPSTCFRRLTSTALRISKFPKAPTLDALRAYLIYQSTEMKEEEPLTCVAFVGLALRAANMLGLHRDPSHFKEIMPAEAEERRLVWWHLIHIDTIIAVAAGLPPLIDLRSWDVHEISEMPLESITDPPAPTGTRVGLINPSPAMLFVKAKLKFSFAIRRNFGRLQSGDALSETEQLMLHRDFVDLGDYLNSAITLIHGMQNEIDQDQQVRNADEDTTVLSKWTRLLLSTFIDQRYSVLSYPLLRHHMTGPWENLYAETVQACISFLAKMAQMSVIKEFERFYWAWPGNHQPLHAAHTVLLDVLQYPRSLHAQHARYVLDVVFALTSANGGLVGDSSIDGGRAQRSLNYGGAEAWRYLRRIRAKAWRAADLDADVHVPRHEAIDFCRSTFEIGETPKSTQQYQEPAFEEVSRSETQTDASIIQGERIAREVPSPYETFYASGLNWTDFDLNQFLDDGENYAFDGQT